MRTLASYALVSTEGTASEKRALFEEARHVVEEWRQRKGAISEDGKLLRYYDGRIAEYRTHQHETPQGLLAFWQIVEPTEGGRFETTFRVGCSQTDLAFSCQLRAGNPANVLAPVRLEARCPRVVKDIMALPVQWKVLTTPVTLGGSRCYGAEQGKSLGQLLLNKKRALPVIVVSGHHGLYLHPEISGAIADDLAGLAAVFEIDDDASWELGRTIGFDLNCYNGAIRLYWPFLGVVQKDPFKHPLWTVQRLLQGAPSTEWAAARLRHQLRRLVFGISAFTIRMPAFFEEIYDAKRNQESKERLRLIADSNDFQALADVYSEENKNLKEELDRQRFINRQLREDLQNTQLYNAWSEAGQEGILPVDDVPPATMIEAVERARREFAGILEFGKSVSDGVGDLAPSAGPPDKILDYLRALSEMAIERRAGSLGTNMVKWLSAKGYSVSLESETTQNSKSEMTKRRWHDGREIHQFNLHMKPTESTSPDKCVRIYFDWDSVKEMIVIGWIGRHP